MDYTRERRGSGREYSGTGIDYTLRGSGIPGQSVVNQLSSVII